MLINRKAIDALRQKATVALDLSLPTSLPSFDWICCRDDDIFFGGKDDTQSIVRIGNLFCELSKRWYATFAHVECTSKPFYQGCPPRRCIANVRIQIQRQFCICANTNTKTVLYLLWWRLGAFFPQVHCKYPNTKAVLYLFWHRGKALDVIHITTATAWCLLCWPAWMKASHTPQPYCH